MAQNVVLSVNVYQINDYALSAPQAFAFPYSQVKFRPVTTPFAVGGVTVNGIVEEYAHGLQVGNAQYYVAQTVAQLVTLAQA